MRKTALLIAAWFGAGVLAVTAASIGVSMVGQQVTGDRPAPLSATEVREELAAAAAGADPSTTTSAPLDPVSSSVPPGPAAEDPMVPATTPTVPAPPPPAASPTANSTPPPSPSAETRTYNLVGGTATLRFTAAGVTVVTATPKAGFSVEVEPEHGNGVQVEFRSDDHRSRVDGWWANGPLDDVREDD